MPRQTKAATKSTARKQHPLNMRTTKALRDRLEKAAANAGRSLAQEVEYRLQQSFHEGDIKAAADRGYREVSHALSDFLDNQQTLLSQVINDIAARMAPECVKQRIAEQIADLDSWAEEKRTSKP